jgi:DNA-binding protein Fis
MHSFKKAIWEARGSGTKQQGPQGSQDNFLRLKEVVDLHVSEAMRQAQGKQSIAAELLGISGAALSKRLKKTPELKSMI